MRTIISEIIGILDESALYLLLGFLLAGVLHVVLTRYPRLMALLTGQGARPVLNSALLGMPMPLCSCGVLPAAMTLRRKGASKGATASFLISVPETDIVSILLTLALLGGVVAVYRPLAALATAVAAGLVINLIERRARSREATAAAATETGGCCCHAGEGNDESILDSSDTGPWPVRVVRYGFGKIFDDIVAQLLLGIVIAGVLMAWLPGVEAVVRTQGAVWTYALMLLIGVPVYVCAVASTPVAAGLIAGGLSPGAVMVFLLAGPATNIASLFVLRGEFGNRVLAVYLAAIAVGSVAAGVAFDAFLGHTVSAADVARRHHEHGSSLLSVGASVLFVVLALASLRRTNVLGRLKSRVLAFARSGGR